MLAIKTRIDPEHGEVHQEPPEIRLLRAMIERGITDAIHPERLRDRRASATFTPNRKARFKEVRALMRSWKDSKLTAAKFCTSRGISPDIFARDRGWYSYTKNEAVAIDSKYPNAYDWLWSDSVAPWSFLWCLAFFFDDARAIAEKIKKYILLRRKNIAWE